MGTESERTGGLDHLRRAETPLAIETPDLSRERARESGEIADSTRQELQRLKDRIESGDIDESLIGGLIDAIQDLPPEKLQQKPMILSMLLTSLHKKGIRFGGFENGTVTFLPKGGEEALKYQKHLQDALKNGVFSKGDFQKALLFATSELQAFSSEIQETTNVADYVVSLMNKHGVEYKGVTVSENGETKIPKPSASSYATFRDFLLHRIPDQADSDFLVAYFDDVYYKDGAGFQGNPLSDYKKLIGENQGEFARAFRDLNYEQRQVLGVTTPDDVHDKASQYANNPMSIFSDAIKGGGLHAGAVLGIIGAIFFGKKGFFGGLVLGLLGGLVSPSEAKNFITGLFDAKQSPSYKKYREAVLEKRDGLDKEKTEMLYTALMQNEKFKVKSAKNIYIFQKSSLDQKEFFESCGIWLNDENTPYYKHIFARIIASRKADGIEPRDEQMIEYLNRKKEQTVVAGAPVPGTGEAPAGGTSPTPPSSTPETPAGTPPSSPTTQTTPPGPGGTPPVAQALVGGVGAGGAEIIRESQNQLLTYFEFSSHEKSKVINFFDTLNTHGMNISLEGFLGAYKGYLENHSFSQHQTALKESIRKRVLYAIKEIDIQEMIQEENKKYSSLAGFRDNRWIIDGKFDDVFSDFDKKVLPTTSILKQILDQGGNLKPGINLNEEQKEQLAQARRMFQSEIREDGRFNDSDYSLLNTYDYFNNNWDIFDAESFISDVSPATVPERTLLDAQDAEIKQNAIIGTMVIYSALAANDIASFTGILTVPTMIASAVYDIGDVISHTVTQEELVVKLLKFAGVIPQNFRRESTWTDTILATIGIIPGVTALTRGKYLTDILLNSAKGNIIRAQIFKAIPGLNKQGDEISNLSTSLNALDTARKNFGASAGNDLKNAFNQGWSSVRFPANLSPTDLQKLQKEFDEVKKLIDDKMLAQGIPQGGQHTPDQLKGMESIFEEVSGQIAHSYPELAKHIFPTNLHQMVDGVTTASKSVETIQTTLDPAKKYTDPQQLLDSMLERRQMIDFMSHGGWSKIGHIEGLKHMFDDLLSVGTEVQIGAMKFSKTASGYVGKDPVSGTEVTAKSFVELMSHKDIRVSPMDVIQTYSKTNFAKSPELVGKINSGLLSKKPLNVEVNGVKSDYVMQVDSATHEVVVFQKNGNQLTKVNKPEDVGVVLEAFRTTELPKIVDKMYDRYISVPLSLKVAPDVLQKIYDTLKNNPSGAFTMTWDAFKKLPLKDFIKMSADLRRKDSVIKLAYDFGKNWKTTAKNIFIANTGTALLYSGVEAGYDKYVKEGEGNYWGDVGDRWVDYAIGTIPLTEILRFFDRSPSEIAGGMFFGN